MNIWCRLLGHKFMIKNVNYLGREGMYERFGTVFKRTTFCIRCGEDNPNYK